MFTRVLLPTDCSTRARSLVALISGLKPSPEHVCAAVVVPISGMEQPLIEAHIAEARDNLEALVAPLREQGVDVTTRVLTGRPAQALLKTAAETRSDGILIGSYGKDPMQEVLKGSLSAELTRQSELPVLSIRFGALWDKSLNDCSAIGRRLYERPLHPTDMSTCSRRALDRISERLVASGQGVDLVHVVDDVYQSGEVHEREVRDARAYLEAAEKRLRADGIDARAHLVEGDPVADIMRLANEFNSSCIVLGSHGKSLVREAVVGSVSQGILRMSSRPVLVMH